MKTSIFISPPPVMCFLLTFGLLLAADRVLAQPANAWDVPNTAPYYLSPNNTCPTCTYNTGPIGGITTNNIFMGINVSSLSFPYPTITPSTPQPFPLVVGSNLYSSTSEYVNILLSSADDHNMRSIIGLSTLSGIGIYSGNDDKTGAGIRLNAYGSAIGGVVQTLSYGDPTGSSGGPLTLAFEHINYNYATPSYSHLFRMDVAGHTRIGHNNLMPSTSDMLTIDGSIYINDQDNVDGFRNIYARSTNTGLNITAGSNTDGSDGACFTAYARNAFLNRGAFVINSYGAYSTAYPLGFAYINNDGSAAHNNFLINKSGSGIIGPDVALSNIATGDIFTVKDQMGFYDHNDLNWRGIHGNTTQQGIALAANTNYTDGPLIGMNGTNNASGTGKGSINYISNCQIGSSPAYCMHTFNNYDPVTHSYAGHLGITNNGNTVIGKNVAPWQAGIGDMLTVQDQIGFYTALESDPKTINCSSNTGYLQITTNAYYGDQATRIKIYSIDNADAGGQIQYFSANWTSPGLPQFGHTFYNWNTWGTNTPIMGIGNQNNVTIGEGADPDWAQPGDVLTVLNQIGFVPNISGSDAAINGNASKGRLQIAAGNNNTSLYPNPYNLGSYIQLYGGDAGSQSGSIRYHSTINGAPGAIGFDAGSAFGHIFYVNNTGLTGYVSNEIAVMGIYNQGGYFQHSGTVIIGDGVDPSWYNFNDRLTVHSQIGFHNTNLTDWSNINGNRTEGGLNINANTGSNNGPTIEMYGNNVAASGGENRAGGIHLWSNSTSAPDPAHPQYGFMYGNYDPDNHWQYQAAITNTGKMIIGHDLIAGDPTVYTLGNYSLYVENGVLTEHVRVAIRTTSNWSDNVFSKNYKLMPLAKLEDYVKTKSHLPDVPSAKEVVKDGIDLGSMDSKLLQKIEELTLYAIQQQKQIDELQKKVQSLTNK